eukprot:20895-Heterococcus_DN1.PRE.13
MQTPSVSLSAERAKSEGGHGDYSDIVEYSRRAFVTKLRDAVVWKKCLIRITVLYILLSQGVITLACLQSTA